jgi:hypothetical protein
MLEERRGVLVPGASDALAARVIAGAGIANTLHRVPDIGLISLA